MGRYHLDVLAGVGELDVVAVADASRDALDAVAPLLPAGATAYGDATSAFRHPGVEACLIATSTPTHPELTAAALGGGLHVLCEKPLTLQPGAVDLGGMAAAHDLLLQIGFWRRFSPPWLHAKRLIAEGAIGQPLMVRLAQWDAHPPPPEFCDPAVSGGLAIDCGVHEFDLAEWLTGRHVTQVWSRALPVVDERLAECGDVDNLLAVLDLDGGGVATVDLSRNARYGDDVRTEVLGSEGALFIELLPTGRVRLASGAGVELIEETPDAMRDGVAHQARAFAAVVRGQKHDLPGAEASDRAVRIGLAVQRSATTGSAQVVA